MTENDRTIRRSISLAVALFLLTMLGGASWAHAQGEPNACCGFSMIAGIAIPAPCFPITVTTSWAGVTQADVITTGSTLTPVFFPNCPPAPTPFDWASLDGGVTTFGLGKSPPLTLPCGFCVRVNVTKDAGGCIRIHIAPC